MKTIGGLVAGAMLLAIYYVEGIEDHRGLSAEYTQGPEALSWLRKNHNESALASNRFPETRDAIRLVQQLYSAGAQRVIVPAATIQNDGDETYADALVVTLPADPTKRQSVWKLCAQELRREGGKPSEQADEDQVLLWWD